MVAKFPVITVPVPISIVANPLMLVVGVCVSTYTGVPEEDP
jgi:hypothetical protein